MKACVRRYDANSDASTVHAWLVRWGMLPASAPMPPLPAFGAVAVDEDAVQAAAFLAETDAGYATVVNCIADRDLPHARRRAALRACLEAIGAEADRRGLALVAFSSRHSVVSLFRELGWSTADKQMVQIERPARTAASIGGA